MCVTAGGQTRRPGGTARTSPSRVARVDVWDAGVEEEVSQEELGVWLAGGGEGVVAAEAFDNGDGLYASTGVLQAHERGHLLVAPVGGPGVVYVQGEVGREGHKAKVL